MSIFIDTGAFYAMADKRDKFHFKGKNYYVENYEPGQFITSNFVFVESWTLIHHKLGKNAAQTFWNIIRSGTISLKQITLIDLERAWEIFNKYFDHNFSLVDCTSFAIMEHLKILDAFTFDSDFLVFRTETNQPLLCHPD